MLNILSGIKRCWHASRRVLLAEVQKTIATYYFALISKLLAGDRKKAWHFVIYACPPCRRELLE